MAWMTPTAETNEPELHRAGTEAGLSFGLTHPVQAVHQRPRATCAPWSERSRPVADGPAQSSKACEGATSPWVQIPPPPPLICKNTGTGSRQVGAWCSPGLNWWSQLRVMRGPAARISRGCYAWSRTPRTALNRSTHAAEASALPFRAGRDRPRPAGYPPTYRPHHSE